MSPRFSLVVPAWNEERFLPRLLDSVDAARAAYSGGADAIEVVVADNASTDGTAEIARRRGCVVAPVAKRVIAAARNGGAAVSRGEVLCFLDADSRIHPATFDVVDAAVESGRYVAGATGVTLERRSPGIAATWAVVVALVALLGMDTGVVFCRREDFAAVGGYDETRLFAEDVHFLWKLRRHGRPTRRRLVRLRRAKAVASTRKFDEHGDWHYFTELFRLAPLILHRPTATTDFVRRYWYEGR